MHSDDHITLFHKHLAGELSDEERRTLEVWLNEAPENRRQFEEAKRIWTLTASAGSELDIDLDHEVARFKQRIHQDPPQARIFSITSTPLFRFAAAAAVLLGGIILLLRYGVIGSPETILIETFANETREVTLPDQSTVWLNENSQLSYAEAFKKRSVQVTGEAFFEVTHDPNHPFDVSSGTGRVQVLGTSFSVRNNSNEDAIRVTVATGRVAFGPAGSDQTALLDAGYQGVLKKSDHTLSQLPNDNPAFLAWHNRPLVFENTPLYEVVEMLRAHFALVIEAPDAHLATCTFTGEFEEPVLGEIIQALSFSLNVTASTNQGVYAFTGIGCSE